MHFAKLHVLQQDPAQKSLFDDIGAWHTSFAMFCGISSMSCLRSFSQQAIKSSLTRSYFMEYMHFITGHEEQSSLWRKYARLLYFACYKQNKSVLKNVGHKTFCILR